METQTADFLDAVEDPKHPYHKLAYHLMEAFLQAAEGKGHERHANELPFHQQRMQSISQGLKSAKGMGFQVCKKTEEGLDMGRDAALHELHGAMVYAAGACIYVESHYGS